MTHTKANTAGEPRIVLFQARTPVSGDPKIFFLLSAKQVVEVTDSLPIWPVPLAPSFTDGMAWWQQQVVAVVSPEKCAGLVHQQLAPASRMLVVRARNTAAPGGGMIYGIFQLGSNVRHIFPPADCRPLDAAQWPGTSDRLQGAYRWQQDIILVPDVEHILNGGSDTKTSPG